MSLLAVLLIICLLELLAETETSSTEDNATIWRIKTKYYEADVELISFQACDISKAASSVAQRIDALVLIFDEHKILESFYPLLQWFQSDAFDPAVCLCVGINSSLVDHKKAVTVEGELFDSVEDFCLDRMFEYIDYDEEDSVKRLIEALQTNIWDGHIAVDNKKAEAQDFAFSSELKQLEQMFGKMARDNSAEAEQDADREEDEFDLGVLLSKLKDIRGIVLFLTV